MTKAEDGQILFATHQALNRLPPDVKAGWDLIIDETPTTTLAETIHFPDNHRKLTEHIDVLPFNQIFGSVVVRDRSSLENLRRNNTDDELNKPLVPAAHLLTNPHYRNFVNLERYERLISGENESLIIHSILQPSVVEGFDRVFIAAANFQHSAVYQLWSRAGVIFREDNSFYANLRYTTHTNGHLVRIRYVTDRNWSKYFSRQKVTPDKTVIDHIPPIVHSLFGDADFVWHANINQPDNLLGGRGTRLPSWPYGLNNFTHVHNIACLSALNNEPEHLNLLKNFGMGADEVRTSMYYEITYQSVMRTSIRNPDNTDVKTIFVADRGVAEYLRNQFPGASIEKHESPLSTFGHRKPGRRRKYNSDRDRKRINRQAEKEYREKLIDSMLSLVSHDGAENDCGPDSCPENTKEASYRNLRTDFVGSLFEHANSPLPYVLVPFEYAKFLPDLLRRFHKRVLANKSENRLISPAIYDPDLHPTVNRGKPNIQYARHIWLDFDDAAITPDKFPSLFPNLEMVVTNSFRHTPEKPRYRVVIFTSVPMTSDVYETMYDLIAAKIRQAGFAVTTEEAEETNKPHSGLDWGKRVATSLFNLPAQAQNPEYSFFKHHHYSRKPLDPLLWIRNSELTPKLPVSFEPRTFTSAVNQGPVDRAIEEWKRTPEGSGNDEFFGLGKALWLAGLDEPELDAKLHELLIYANSPDDRKRQIPKIIEWLRTRLPRSSFRDPELLVPLQSPTYAQANTAF